MAPSLRKGALNDLQNEAVLSSVSLEGTHFLANGHPFLTNVPRNIISTPAPFTSKDVTRNIIGSFVGFHTDKLRSRHVAPIGKLRNIPFMSLFRFKVWWTTHWIGNNGKDVEFETQMMLLDKSDLGHPYVLLLPLLEGPFGASLQPGNDDDVDVCVDSGSSLAVGSTFRSCVYIHVGIDPYQVVKDAMRVIKNHLGTFNLLEDKTVPAVVDTFGWCTWDAFYLKVHPQGIREGVQGLAAGGCPPGLVLIDDGWQSISCTDNPDDQQEGMNYTVAGEQMPCRLLKFEENYKFRDYQSKRVPYKKGMGAFVSDLKEEFKSIEHVYVWHTLCGYWSGLRENFPGMSPENCEVVEPRMMREGLQTTMEDLAVDQIARHGVGVVSPDKVGDMYEGLHSHLEAVGIDGAKVDAIQISELVGEKFGGRIALGKAYYKALTLSMRKHFKGNCVIASMEQCNDFMYLGTEAIALGRVGDDFWCTDPNGDPYWLQGLHMVHCAYNSLWMGNIIQPDWDMFQSTHPTAEFHAASRAISGGLVYVSDRVGHHDFVLLRTLVLPDGSILRCQSYALPTRDSLFLNPSHDGKSVLKIWNLNKFTGVLGAFNCQGGGWCPKSRQNKLHFEAKCTLTCLASPKDIEWSNKSGRSFIPIQGVGAFAVYMNRRRTMKILKFTDSLEIALSPYNYELLTVSPVRVVGRKAVEFAPIGLVNMLNSGGAIESVKYDGENVVEIVVRGCGKMAIYASEKPRACLLDGVGIEFGYDERMVIVDVAWPGSCGLSELRYLF
ncbi:galactinol--sucrose galactosyltransferase-like [Cynara cardunculus var. scolymus]|uniref:galactinol--sucrose galactosyltransferase n=1 Tax=Cynara cardunculus var. scolymus TaxID=59895 RepID=A0A118K3Q2_CYNCS|nr:galactinol--sucrose galactosyltransferase-like [Cynara cardunculus var. scolymus]KVI06288.1 Aldolase-type TIM barrel [Cynara cardunculus var. scolymus]